MITWPKEMKEIIDIECPVCKCRTLRLISSNQATDLSYVDIEAQCVNPECKQVVAIDYRPTGIFKL